MSNIQNAQNTQNVHKKFQTLANKIRESHYKKFVLYSLYDYFNDRFKKIYNKTSNNNKKSNLFNPIDTILDTYCEEKNKKSTNIQEKVIKSVLEKLIKKKNDGMKIKNRETEYALGIVLGNSDGSKVVLVIRNDINYIIDLFEYLINNITMKLIGSSSCGKKKINLGDNMCLKLEDNNKYVQYVSTSKENLLNLQLDNSNKMVIRVMNQAYEVQKGGISVVTGAGYLPYLVVSVIIIILAYCIGKSLNSTKNTKNTTLVTVEGTLVTNGGKKVIKKPVTKKTIKKTITKKPVKKTTTKKTTTTKKPVKKTTKKQSKK